MVGAVISASLSFVIARYLARGAVERQLATRPSFRAIDTAVADQGLRVVLLLRLSPLFPFFLLNYALGLTRVRYIDFLIGLFGMVPATAFYVYYGTVAGDLAAALGGGAHTSAMPRLIVLALGVAATIAVSVVITRAATRALAQVAPVLPVEPGTVIGGINSDGPSRSESMGVGG
jgi:uncharacterized membrane protein YdjX (TVP38/TMEM64 family)